MGDDYSEVALLLSVVTFVIIVIIIFLIAFEYPNIMDAIENGDGTQTKLIITQGTSNTSSETFTPPNQSVYMSSPSISLTLSIGVSSDIEPGFVFYVSNTNTISQSSTVVDNIIVIPSSGVVFTNRNTEITTTQVIVSPGETAYFLWRSATEVTLLSLI